MSSYLSVISSVQFTFRQSGKSLLEDRVLFGNDVVKSDQLVYISKLIS